MSSERLVNSLPVNPYDSANVVSKVLFFWLNPFIKLGFRKELVLDDLYRVPKENLSKDLGYKLKKEWDKELKLIHQGKKPSFVRALCQAFGFWYLLSGLWITLGECIVRPLQAISLGWLIRDVNFYLTLNQLDLSAANQQLINETYWSVFYDGLIMVFFSIIALITVHPYVFCTQHTGMKVRIACCQLIYRHSLKLSNAAIGQTTVGQMVNLLTNDVNRFDVALNYIQYLAIAPIQAIISVAVLSYMYLGFYSTAAGSALLLLYVPFQSLMGRWFGSLRELTAKRTDERIRLMNEIVPAMRVIKMYTWEDPFALLVELARKNEVRFIRYTSILRGINMALFFVSSKIILFISFITYVLLGYSLDAEIVFVAITLFNTVRLLMTLFFPYGVAQLAETLISCSRLQEFLLLPQQESSPLVDRGFGDPVKPDDVEVVCNNASAYWTIVNKNFDLDSGDKKESEKGLKKQSSINGSKQEHKKHRPSIVVDSYSNRFSASNHDFAKSSSQSLFSSTSNVHLRDKPASYGLNTEKTGIRALESVSYDVKAGELLIIVGRVGSGKSSLLMSILGELPLNSGRLKIRGKISYSAQEPWIFAGTVRENVLFGRSMDLERYEKVLNVCSLDKDIKLFPQGDATIVGERGVSLSGGQRARINLARAIYYDADIYLLDDPLSAVDAVVAKHIFNECITGFLKQKAVILATHQTQFVKKDTKVVLLSGGRRINHSNTKDLSTFIGSSWEKSDSEANLSSANRGQSKQQQQQPKQKLINQQKAAEQYGGGDDAKKPLLESPSEGSDGSDSGDDDNEKIVGEAPIKQHSVESSNNDNVGCSIYWHYIKACHAGILVLTTVITNVGTQVLFNGSDFWLSLWTDTEQRKVLAGGTSNYEPVTLTDTLTLRQNALIYTILIASLFVLTLIRTTCFFVACMRASISLHNRLFRSVLKAPIAFFDYNPIGILLNRVSRDMGIVDDLLPPTAFDTIEIFVNVLGILVTVAIIYPINVIPAVILCTIVAVIRLLYIRTVRSIKSIEGVTRSPVFSHLAASLNGLTTIRAFRVEPEFERKFDNYQDVHSSAWFLFVASSRWLGISLDWLSLGYITVITVVMTLTVGSTTGSQIGLAISSALFLSGSFQWGVRQSTEMESQMTSVARIKEYSELPEEPPRESEPDMKPPPEWPAEGAIEFDSVNLRYNENDEPVLKSLTFKIKPGEKIGIVGRTGAGKSSIIAVLFRLTEPEGSILIDNVDTKSIGLHDLRKKLSIIPQEPILFNGPVRRNLDPFDEYTDVAMWKALEQVNLSDAIRSLPGGLDAELAEGGSNFSVGERQLICLARAVLRANRIIVLDEATANVDPTTDKFIQKTISETFTNCTRLTIAHRLNTIMDSDRVLVMDAGQVKEFDVPHLLLQNENGFFSTMVKNTGKNAAHLKKVARNNYEKRYGKAPSLV